MLIKASQRGSGAELARHLLNVRDNDHIEIHTVDGFIAEDVRGAFQEVEALSRGTKCSQYLFSVSFNPPQNVNVSTVAFEEAIAQVAQKNGLENQPHVIVFHEKNGRRHAHAVWSRIEAMEMKAINLPFYKNRVMDVSKAMYLKHGWDLPKGFIDREYRNPLNFTLKEWQHAKRLGDDPKVIKQVMQNCWKDTRDHQSFAKAMESHGFTLAQGNRRGFVAVDWRGEAYSLSRYAALKKKDLTARLGKPDTLSSVDQVKARQDQALAARMRQFIKDVQQKYERKFENLNVRHAAMKVQHAQERNDLAAKHAARERIEIQQRQDRLNTGFRGLWDRVTGRHSRIRDENAHETYAAARRDQGEKDDLIYRQLEQRQALQGQFNDLHTRQAQDVQAIKVAVFSKLPEQKIQALRSEIIREFDQSHRKFTMEM